MKYAPALLLLISQLASAFADGPADNHAESVRPIPPIGIQIPKQQSHTLAKRCEVVRSSWKQLLSDANQRVAGSKSWQRPALQQTADALHALTPEVLVFPRCVELALEFNQFYKDRDLEFASQLLDEAARRIRTAAQNPSWSHVVGIDDGQQQQLIVGGYRSKIDGSFQPYTLVIPPGYTHGDSRPRRLDIWFHGRGETLSEVNFLGQGRTSSGQYTPDDTFVLHPYGRYSNAFKFAGEIDVLEALKHVQDRLPVNDAKTSVRGFSMGGAACWQFATHYSDRFFAANPGAGFSETPEFLKSFQGEDLQETPQYQRTLWRLYDCTYWSRNLIHCPTVAYSGEIDRQKQAADVMQQSLAKHQIELTHIIGPQTAHKIHPDSKREIESRMDGLAALVTAQPPMEIDFTTQTLRYNHMHWVHLVGLGQHWKSARVQASIQQGSKQPLVTVQTSNVTQLRLSFSAGQWPTSLPARPVIEIDGARLAGPSVQSDRGWDVNLKFQGNHWEITTDKESELRKSPGLQGPIDDAFMDSFLFVMPSGGSKDEPFQSWCEQEGQHAQLHWRKHFRGDILVVPDHELTEEQIANHNLIVFGDPESNSVLRSMADELPIRWTTESIELGSQKFPRKNHAVAMIYPNPLNPNRYVVLNSGFTFREYDYLNNARQTPKLPDWAIIDIIDGSTNRSPGVVRAAGFFDEQWNP